MNITATADTGAIDVANVENININWNGFGTPEFDLENVSGATVTLTSTKTGYLGSAGFTNVGENDVVVGAGVKRTVTVDAIEDASITASVATTLTVTGADGTVTVNAGAAETVSITGADDVVLVALSADDVTIETAFDTAEITLGVDTDLEVDGADDATVTINSEENIEVTIEAGSEYESLTVSGAGTVALSFAAAADVEGLTIDNPNGTVTLTVAPAASGDYTGVTAEEIIFELNADENIFVASGQTFRLQDSNTAGDELLFQTNVDDDTDADTLTVVLEVVEAGILGFDSGGQSIETVNITIEPDDDFDTDVAFTIEQINASGDATVVLTSTDSDVNVDIDALNAPELDASGVEGDIVVDSAQTTELTIIGAAGTTTVVTAAMTEEFVYLGTGGDSDLTINSTTGDVSIIDDFDGDNDIELDDITNADVYIQTSDGDDEVSLSGGAPTGIIELVLGGGDNALVLGTGTDLTGAEVSLSGVDEIVLLSGDTTADVSSDLLDGAAIEISSTDAGGVPTAVLNVVLAADVTSFDGSSLTINDSIASAALGLNISVTDAAAAYDIIASEGDDTIELADEDDLDAIVAISGGDGDDTLALTGTVTIVDDDLANVSGVEEIDLSGGNNSITLGSNAVDSGIILITGSGGDDEIDLSDADFDYADTDITITVDAGAGNDDVTLSDNVDVYVIEAGDSESGAGTYSGAAVAVDDFLTFGAGDVDIVRGFDAVSGDQIDNVNGDGATAAVTAIGEDQLDLDEDTIFFLSGSFNELTGVFTIMADGTGDDTLIFENETTAANDDLDTVNNAVVLIGVDSDDLAVTTFI
jgi:hypothetical protein